MTDSTYDRLRMAVMAGAGVVLPDPDKKEVKPILDFLEQHGEAHFKAGRSISNREGNADKLKQSANSAAAEPFKKAIAKILANYQYKPVTELCNELRQLKKDVS